VRTWFAQHRRAFGLALRRLWAAPVNTLFGVLVVGITLALPAGGEMLLGSLLAFGRHLTAAPELSVFLKPEISPAQVSEIEQRLRQHAAVAAVRFVGREETLKRYRESEGLAEVLDTLPENPFPDAFIVTPRSGEPAALDALSSAAAAWPAVEQVQLDSDWARRLDALLRAGRVAVLLLAGLLGLAIVAVSFNTIRLQILTQRAEVEVSRLLGATDGYIRRPFYYFGLLQGALGGVVAWLIVLLAAQVLRQPFAEVASLYGLEFRLQALPLVQTAILVGFAALLGWLGARLSVSRHLRAPEGA
jgi:cell division transport system permease protein